MKSKYISILGLMAVLPAFAGARLPAVNMAAGAISARAQYGAATQNETQKPKTIRASKLVPVKTDTDTKRGVVSRDAKKKSSVNKDTGEPIALNAEYLIPNRPSSDLWARSDTPLRMPHANEFSLITSDELLPEESISGTRITTAKKQSRADEIAELSARTANLDSQIARLIELQQQAESVARSKSIAKHDSVIMATNESEVQDGDVKLSRMVVPRDDLIGNDVVVRAVQKDASAKIQDVRDDMTKMSPSELRRAFRKTFLSENKHLSTYPIDDRFDIASDISTSFEGFTSARDLSEDAEKIRPLEIKIRFRDSDAALSRENYNLLSEYAGIVVANPKRAIQVAIPANATDTAASRKLAARRLAIVEQVLRDTGVSEQRIVPVLSNRDEAGFVLRIISNEQFETLTTQRRNMFGDTVGSKTYKSMSW